jgi:hypothetical protein
MPPTEITDGYGRRLVAALDRIDIVAAHRAKPGTVILYLHGTTADELAKWIDDQTVRDVR